MLTPIHRALGLTPGAFDRALIEQAVTGEVAEGTDLDWKRSAPALKADPDREEFAKDVAAMANSGGGWIVYGIAEKQGEANTADSVTPVTWGTDHEQRFRQAAYALVAPPVAGLEFHPVPWDDGGYVVGMRVPASLDVPHFAVFKKDGFRAPRRDGAHTHYMDARQIEEGFRQRFRGRADQRRTLDEMYVETVLSAPTSAGVCLVVAATPVTEGQVQAPNSSAEARATGFRANAEGIARRRSASMLDGWANGKLHKGLRGWQARSWNQSLYQFAKWIGDDGSVRAYYQLGGWDGRGRGDDQHPYSKPGHCMDNHVECALADVAASLRRHAEQREVHDGYRLRIGLEWDDRPIVLRTLDWAGFLHDEDDAVPIHQFHPVYAEYDPLAPREEWLPALRQVAEDVVNQGGISELTVLESIEVGR